MMALYKSGLLSAREVANDLLFESVRALEIDSEILLSINSMPEDVRGEFSYVLQGIREADFRWIPPLLGVQAERDPNEYSNKLRQVCAFLENEGNTKS
jgi:hypothetical protein